MTGAAMDVQLILSLDVSNWKEADPPTAADFPQMMEKVLPTGIVTVRSAVMLLPLVLKEATVPFGAPMILFGFVAPVEDVTASTYSREYAGSVLVRSTDAELAHMGEAGYQAVGLFDQYEGAVSVSFARK